MLPEEPKAKPHISASQLDQYCKCPEQYRRVRIEHDPIPPGIAMIRGRSIHKGAEANYRQKLETHTDLPRQDIVDKAVAEFELGVADGIYLCREDASVGKDIIVGKAKDETVSLAGLLADEVLGLYQPVSVEDTQRIVLPNSPRDIIGILDLVANEISCPNGEPGIVDYKSGKSKPQSHWDSATGLTIYGLTYRAKYGKAPGFIRVEQLVSNKKPKRVPITTQRERHDFEACVSRVNVVLDAIEKQVFPPAMPGSWWCSPKWCGFFENGCPYVNGERKCASADAGE